MGFYFRVAPGVKVRATSRGLRASVGPRAARVHFGAGGTGVSTGAGPFTYYAPVHGSKQRTSTGRTTRALQTASRHPTTGPTAAQQRKAAEAQPIIDAINAILNLHRATFPAATAPVAAAPALPSYEQVLEQHKKAATAGIGWIHRHRRAEAEARATTEAQQAFSALQADAKRAQDAEQQRLDEWWRQLLANEPHHVMWALTHAFEDNEAAAAATGVQGATASIVVHVPGVDALPERMPGTTAAGNLSLRKMTKSQASDLYKVMVCGYLVVTVKEAFAVAPGLADVAIVAVRQGPTNAYGARHPEAVAAVRFQRQALVGIQWKTADAVQVVNDAGTDRIIETTGAAKTLVPIEVTGHPDIKAALDAVDLQERPAEQ